MQNLLDARPFLGWAMPAMRNGADDGYMGSASRTASQVWEMLGVQKPGAMILNRGILGRMVKTVRRHRWQRIAPDGCP